MTGILITVKRSLTLPVALSAMIVLSACDEGAGSNLSGDQPDTTVTRSEQDVERPDIFGVSDRGLWDGRPSLGGIWVAHPDVREPERVVIRNAANGQSTIGALFRRERANPGPTLQLSSDAAEALGILAGAPTEVNVVALRREEVVSAPDPVVAEVDPVEVEALPAPAEIAATPLAHADTVPAGVPDDRVEIVLPPTPSAAAPAASAPVAATPAPISTGLPPAPVVQIGVFSLQANADAAAASLQSAGFTASVIPRPSASRPRWRVVAGPASDQAALARMRALGFPDAYILQTP